jgi:hypothetical protein
MYMDLLLLDAPLSEQRMSSTYVAIVCTCPGGSCTNTQLKSLKPAQSLPARARQLMHASFQPCTACPVDEVIFVTYRTTRLGAIPSPERQMIGMRSQTGGGEGAVRCS